MTGPGPGSGVKPASIPEPGRAWAGGWVCAPPAHAGAVRPRWAGQATETADQAAATALYSVLPAP